MKVAIKFFLPVWLAVMFICYLPPVDAKELLPKKEALFHKNGTLQFISPAKNILAEISFELADTNEKRNRGLMYRHTLQKNQGMLFVFDRSRIASFYMKNTYIPLDIIFCDEQKKIVKIFENTTPLTVTSLSSDVLVRFAVEVNAGFVTQHGIKNGDFITYKATSAGGA
jgi:uncharacterized membrane protein (UPF0127 family)